MEVKLLGELERNAEAFSWSIEDIKGISPSICINKILMKEDHAPSIEHLMSILNTHFIPMFFLYFGSSIINKFPNSIYPQFCD